MTKSVFRKGLYASGSALRAVALLGAGLAVAGIDSAPLHAQDYTQVTASGRVVDTNGVAIPNATVTITSDDQGFTRTTTTNSSGAYRVPSLPAGDYTFTISADGFTTFTESGVRLDQNGAANQFKLASASASAAEGNAIVVTGSRVQVADFEQTTTGAVINVADIAERVPVARDLTSVIQLAPGVAKGDSAFGNLASSVGSSVSENVFYLNGLNITEFREGLGSVTVPFDFYETVEVKNGGYPAEFGRATGAFVNATTKSGSNEFHGSVKFNWEPDWSSKSPNTLYSDNDFDSDERKDMIAQLSGPIIKDHLFFYGLYNARDVTSRFATTSPVYARDADGNPTNELASIGGNNAYYDHSDSPFFGGKLDAVIVDGQRLEFTYFNSSGTNTRNIYAYNDPATNSVGDYKTTQVFEYGGENYVGRYTGNFFDWLTVSAAYGKYNYRDNQLPANTTLPYISEQRFGTSTSIGNPVNGITTQEDSREFYRADADVYFDLLGSHHIKGGYDREDLTSVNTLTYTGGVAYTYLRATDTNPYGLEPGTDYVEARTFVNGGTFESRNEAFYLEDSWKLLQDRLTLQLGVRADSFVNRNVAGDVYYDSGWNYQPRLGATFDPTGTGRTKIYGSFGRYYLPIATNTNIRLGGAELDYDKLYVLDGLNGDNTPILGAPITNAECPAGVSGNNCVLRNDGSVSGLDTVVAANLANQSVDEYILGAEQRIGDHWVFGLYGTYRNLNASLEDAAIDQGILTYCADQGISVEDCGGTYSDGTPHFFGAAQYALFNPGEEVTITPAYAINGSYDPITLSPEQLGYPAAKRSYKAATFTFEREFDGVWSLKGSYTLSFNKGNIEGGVKSDNGQTDSGLSTDFDFPSLMLGSYGYLPNDRRHTLKAYGSYAPTDWLTVGANLSVTSPRAFGCLGRVADAVSSPALNASGESYDYGWAYGANGHFCVTDSNGDIVTDPRQAADRSVVDRGTAFKSDWLKQLDLDVMLKLPTDAFDGSLRFSIFNVLNSKAALDFEERGTSSSGTPRADYGAVRSYQGPRSVRMQLSVGF